MKKIFVLIALLLLAACAPKPTIGPLGGIHTHAGFKVYIDGKAIDFENMEYMVRAKYVHIEDMDGDVLHVHATGVTIGEFFRTLGMTFNDRCFVKDNKEYCTDPYDGADAIGKSLKFYVNGEPNAMFGDYLTGDGDKVLISYGMVIENVTAQLASVTDKARAISGLDRQMDLS